MFCYDNIIIYNTGICTCIIIMSLVVKCYAVAACEQFLLNSQLTVQTALSMHEFAYIYGTPHFQTEVKLYVFNHLTAIQNGKEYSELNDGERYSTNLYAYIIYTIYSSC
jgi:hypothetical protein